MAVNHDPGSFNPRLARSARRTGSPRLIRGTPRAVSIHASRAARGEPAGIPDRLTLKTGFNPRLARSARRTDNRRAGEAPRDVSIHASRAARGEHHAAPGFGLDNLSFNPRLARS